MNGRCETDPFDQAIDVCDACYGEFCGSCLVKPKGRKHPICKVCTLIASGVRPGGKYPVRGEKKTAKARRKELREAPISAPAFEYFDLQPDEADEPEPAEETGSDELEPSGDAPPAGPATPPPPSPSPDGGPPGIGPPDVDPLHPAPATTGVQLASVLANRSDRAPAPSEAAATQPAAGMPDLSTDPFDLSRSPFDQPDRSSAGPGGSAPRLTTVLDGRPVSVPSRGSEPLPHRRRSPAGPPEGDPATGPAEGDGLPRRRPLGRSEGAGRNQR